MTVYTAENIINLRDAGGYPCSGGEIRRGFVFRCGIPKAPTENDFALLRSLGIKTIIDLRGDKEDADMPSTIPARREFDYFRIPLLDANPALNDPAFPMSEMYMKSLREYSAGYAELFRLISTLREPFLFHGFLGKDRTGIVAALLQEICGAGREDILDDYSATYRLIKPFVEREIELKTGLIWEQDNSRLQSEKETMQNVFLALDREYSGAEGYLQEAGADPAVLQRIRQLLVAEKTD